MNSARQIALTMALAAAWGCAGSERPTQAGASAGNRVATSAESVRSSAHADSPTIAAPLVKRDPVVHSDAIFVTHPELAFARRAALVRAGPLRLERDGRFVWSPAADSARFAFAAREVITLEEGPAAIRVLVDEGGLRLALYLDPNDFERRPTSTVELLPSSGPRYLDGFVSAGPGAPVELGELEGELRSVSLALPGVIEARGWIPESALGFVFTPEADTPFEPDLEVPYTAYIRDAPNGRAMVTLSGYEGNPVRVAALGPTTEGHRYVRYQSERCVVQGWLAPPPARNTHRVRGPNVRTGSLSKNPRIALPAGTTLHSSPAGPQIGVVLTAMEVGDEREIAASFRKITVFPSLWGPFEVWVPDPGK